ncbi:GDSL-type esterase/lipase family protein [Planococcus chinensis]|uniref:GDSL-type esterase/lipase family protein n=1 Tax=Planococcus chinensis TaxID=272917 RepID=A0ABW4QF06_9BACL
MKTKKIVLAVSMALNIILIGAALWIINAQGGMKFVSEQLKAVGSDKGFPEYYVQKKSIFEALDTPEADKIFLGDSITDHGEFPEYFRDERVLNRGVAEDTSKGVLNRIDEVAGRKPKEVYVMIGVNDIAAGTSMASYKKNMERIIQSFDPKETRVVVQSILPVNTESFNNEISNEKIHQFNETLEQLAKDNEAEYVDLHPHFEDENGQLIKAITIDGIHLKGKGYDMWVEQLENR